MLINMSVRDFVGFLTPLYPLTLFEAYPAHLVRQWKCPRHVNDYFASRCLQAIGPRRAFFVKRPVAGSTSGTIAKATGRASAFTASTDRPNLSRLTRPPKGAEQAVTLPRLIPEGRRSRPSDHKKLLEILRSVRRAFASAKHRAAKRGLPFDLTEEWALEQIERQGFKCAITGIRFLADPGLARARPYTPSFDRIDSSKGYTIDNVRIVIFAANLMMLDWGEAVFHRVSASYHRQVAGP